MAKGICSNCGERPHVARGFCARCYQRWQKHGDPNVVQRPTMPVGDPVVRFWSKIDRRADDECWPWLGYVTDLGYGRFALSRPRRHVKAHRFAYELLVGPIPDGLDLDHTCHDPKVCKGGRSCPHRRCVNPAHLEPVTLVENVMRGAGFAPMNAAKTHCIHGHEFTPENTYIDRLGARSCLICRRAATARRKR